jgi:prepilin-type N-terminal cleavage/methylation domain-containing protein/prepilin-type processing-associated H-X9-DG protein
VLLRVSQEHEQGLFPPAPTSWTRWCRPPRPGFTLTELLVVIAILAVLLALLLGAVQKARTAADRAYCVNNLRQQGIALQGYASVNRTFPPGLNSLPAQPNPNPLYSNYSLISWMTWILPYMDQQPLWEQVGVSFAASPNPQANPPHTVASHVMACYTCPGDNRVLIYHNVQGYLVALTSYLGVNGTNLKAKDGMLYSRSFIRPGDVTDGLSNTIMIGERPPSADLWWGWWYAGAGQLDASQGVDFNSGSCDVTLGAAEINIKTSALPEMTACPSGPYSFGPGQLSNDCDSFHFWSLHSGGAHFAFADGHVRFMPYAAAPIIPLLATRAGGESVNGEY